MLGRRIFVLTIPALGIFACICWYRLTLDISLSPIRHDIGGLRRKDEFDGTWNYTRDVGNLLLDSQQCEEASPGLSEEVARPMNNRMNTHITLKELDAIPQQNGYVRAMIDNQQVCIQHSTQYWSTSFFHRLFTDISVGLTISSTVLQQRAAYTPAN